MQSSCCVFTLYCFVCSAANQDPRIKVSFSLYTVSTRVRVFWFFIGLLCSLSLFWYHLSLSSQTIWGFSWKLVWMWCYKQSPKAPPCCVAEPLYFNFTFFVYLPEEKFFMKRFCFCRTSEKTVFWDDAANQTFGTVITAGLRLGWAMWCIWIMSCELEDFYHFTLALLVLHVAVCDVTCTACDVSVCMVCLSAAVVNNNRAM
jgi:hypothetical protein